MDCKFEIEDCSRSGYVPASRSLRLALGGLVGFRVAVLGVCAFLPLSLPGIWRQTDTMGVSLRYWLRWTVESGARMPLLPAVLNSGDTTGINAMEFPALNGLFAPAFALGPYAGRVVSMLGVLTLVHGLIFLNWRVWKKEGRSLGVDSFGFWLMAVATFSSGWTGKFIPDVVSVLLVLLAVGLSWSRTAAVRSGGLGTLGILMKPTSTVVLALYLAHPRLLKRARANFAWATVSVALGELYYTAGLSWVRQYQDGPGLFAVGFRPFLGSLRAFFADVPDWTNMWMYRPFFSLGLVVVLPLSGLALLLRLPGYRQYLALWGVLLLQYVLIAGLAGPHGFMHDYYFLPLAPTSALLLGWLLTRSWGPKLAVFVRGLVFVGILSPTVELSTMDLRALYKPAQRELLGMASECMRLKARHPEAPWGMGGVFRSTDEPYPELGLCFGEREGSLTAPFGIFWKGRPLPAGCTVSDSEGLVAFGPCR